MHTQITDMPGGWKLATTALIEAVAQAYGKTQQQDKTALITLTNGEGGRPHGG